MASGVTAIADRDGEVTTQSGDLRSRHRSSFGQPSKLGIRPPPEFDQTRKIQSSTRLPLASIGTRRRTIVGTDFLTDVAAIDVAAERATMFVRDLRSQLDRQIGQTAIRVEHTRLDERAGRDKRRDSACSFRTARGPAYPARAAACR